MAREILHLEWREQARWDDLSPKVIWPDLSLTAALHSTPFTYVLALYTTNIFAARSGAWICLVLQQGALECCFVLLRRLLNLRSPICLAWTISVGATIHCLVYE